MSIAHLFTQAVICVNLWIQLFNLSIIDGSSPNRKSSRAFSEPQALPSLVVSDCGKSPNT